MTIYSDKMFFITQAMTPIGVWQTWMEHADLIGAMTVAKGETEKGAIMRVCRCQPLDETQHNMLKETVL